MRKFRKQTIQVGLEKYRTDPRSTAAKIKRVLRPMSKQYRKLFNMRIRDWMEYHHTEIVFKQSYWMGKKVLKNPMDAWIYQEILHEVKPDFVIEIGSDVGGSTLYFAHLLDIIGKGKVISVDISRDNYDVAHERIVEVTGNSSSPQLFAQVCELCQDKQVVVIHDGDHTKEQVLKDMNLYSRLVGVGSYLIIEDGINDLFRPFEELGSFEEGPMAAALEFINENPHFQIDKSRERYIMTYNPNGFLKRIS